MSNSSKLYTNGTITIAADDDGSNAGNILFKTAGTEKARIDSNGVTTFKNDVLIDDGVGRFTLNSISGANRILSTTTNFAAYEDLRFRANNYIFSTGTTQRMRIASDGNVGIGTNSPDSKLEVVNSVDNTTNIATDANAGIIIANGDSDGTAVLKLRGSGANSGAVVFGGGIGAASDKFHIISRHNQTKLFTVKADGNVGIGTSSPAVSLDISATDAIQVPVGATGDRPVTGVSDGMFRYNNTSNSFEGYINGNWGAIGGSGGSGGSGGGTVTVEKNIFTATAAQEDFTITSAPDGVNNLQVYLNGVYQAKDNYTVNGTTVTVNTGTGVATGTEVEIIHLKAVSGIIMVDTFTGDGTATFNLTLSNANENHTQIYLDGVYQSKDNYSIVGKVITFTTAPPSGTAIEVVHLKAVDTSSLNINTFTGNGNTDFTLSESIEDENKTFVFVQGVYQEKSNYSVSGTTLSFLTAPPNGFSIEVMAVGTVSFATVSNANDAKYTPNLISSATTAVAGNLYVFTASATLTLPLSPSNGDTVKISNRSSVETCVIARNSSKIMGLEEDMTIDTAFASFELIYTGSTQGWVII
jgi:hypothetical protein